MKYFLSLAIVFSMLFLANCSSTGKFVKTAKELSQNEGIVIFPMEVHETYTNGNTLFVDKHASSCYMHIYNTSITETTSKFPIGTGTITAPKSWNFNIDTKYYRVPEGTYITSTLGFSEFVFFGLDRPETKAGNMCGNSFAVEGGKINYWGRCIIEIKFNILDKKLTVVSFTLADKSEEDLATFKTANPGLSNLDIVKNIGKRLAQ